MFDCKRKLQNLDSRRTERKQHAQRRGFLSVSFNLSGFFAVPRLVDLSGIKAHAYFL